MKAFKILLAAFALTCAASIGYAVASYDAPSASTVAYNNAYKRVYQHCLKVGNGDEVSCGALAARETQRFYKND